MSIVRMKKLSVIGIDDRKEKVMKKLMNLGAVQITEQQIEEGEEEALTGGPINAVENSRKSEIEGELNKVALALESLNSYNPEKEPLFFTRRAMNRSDFDEVVSDRESIMVKVKENLKLRQTLHRLNEERNKLVNDLSAVEPWTVCDIPFGVKSTARTDIEIGLVPSKVSVDALRKRAEEIDEAVEVKVVNSDKDFFYVIVVTLRENTEETMNVLRQSGFSRADFKGYTETAEKTKKTIIENLEEKKEEITKVEETITSRHGEIKEIECLYDELVMERDGEDIKEKLYNTDRTFCFEGWVPEVALEKVGGMLEKEGCYWKTRDPEEDEEVPVLCQNRNTVVPFESITEMYSLPDYHGVDPTPFFAGFYALFFGMMLSDAGYGIVISLVTFIWLKKFDLEGMTYKMVKMFFYCGLATIFWGALFGSWFGNFIEKAAFVMFDKQVAVKPIWFSPIEDPTKLLIFSLFLGVIHLFVGMGIKAGMLIKRGQFLDAVCDVFSWYLVIGGAVVWAVGLSSETVVKTGKILMLIGAVILLLTGGRNKKGIGKVLGGFGALYDITGYASDILSYSRLLALGLATGVIANVVNEVGSLSGPGIKGTITLIIAFIIGHVFNLAINALGAFVHASRLQYIEFFGKFYEDGGEEFSPFRNNTKYVKLKEDRMEV